MSHEIYYTSAPEGLKRGTSGFCTVAASDNIPRALLERLETLSAYRHQFGVNAQGGSSETDGDGKNPVSHAHWILNVMNKTYHVLSRVCDSGVDHTQRTNAFAHHLVLDNKEIEAAAGGPAWMLAQPGVMANGWDGQVRTLSRGELLRGDAGGSRVCRGWEKAAGDAGWGGHLTDLFVKSPTRPVCILFAPGQDLLGLVAESIALLPSSARWNVTFNTYFTSMPTSATCLWRCCLAGTPAAQLGLRYAASGLVLDLTRPDAMGGGGGVPPGPYVTMARTGQAAAAPAARPTPAVSVVKPPVKNTPSVESYDLADPMDDEEGLLERQRAAIFEAAPAADLFESFVLREMQQSELPVKGPGDPFVTPPAQQAPASMRGTEETIRMNPSPVRPIRRAEEALLEAEAEASRAAQRRRQQVMWLFAGALGAIAIGTGLVWAVYRSSSPPEMMPERAAPPIDHVPRVRIVPPKPDVVQNPILNPQAVLPSAITPEVVQTQPLVPTPVPVATVFPETITLAMPVDRPNVGNGIGDRSQTFPLKASDIDRPGGIGGVRLHFPARIGKSAATALDNICASESLGTLTETAETRNSRPGIALKWKAGGDPGAAAEVLYIAFDKKGPAIDFIWRSGVLLKNPALVGYLYWVIQNSTLELEGNREKGQRIAFKPFEPGTLSINDAAIAIPWPVELPAETAAIPPRQLSLPAGWEASWYTDWEVKEAALRTAANASQILKFKKPTSSAAVDAWFLVSFKPGLGKVECSFERRMAADQNDLANYERELRGINEQIDAYKNNGVQLNKDNDTENLLAKQVEAGKLVDAYKAAVAAYNELTAFDVAFDLPEGLRLATLHFGRTRPAAKPAKTGM